eukprot:3402760-Pleurochrysis_carterae.AAC.1
MSGILASRNREPGIQVEGSAETNFKALHMRGGSIKTQPAADVASSFQYQLEIRQEIHCLARLRFGCASSLNWRSGREQNTKTSTYVDLTGLVWKSLPRSLARLFYPLSLSPSITCSLSPPLSSPLPTLSSPLASHCPRLLFSRDA